MIKALIVHHSYSEYGNALLIDHWHRTRKPTPFRMIGYHWVILNGRPHKDIRHGFPFMNGTIETGRPVNDDPIMTIDEQGAHAYGYNKDTLGVCLIGNGKFTPEQLLSLKRLYDGLVEIGLDLEVKGHYEVGKTKTECPGMDMDCVRLMLSMNYANALQYILAGDMKEFTTPGTTRWL